MFKCKICNKNSKPKERSYKLITKKRDKEYFNSVKKKTKRIEFTTKGYEIVKEIIVCKECYEKSKV